MIAWVVYAKSDARHRLSQASPKHSQHALKQKLEIDLLSNVIKYQLRMIVISVLSLA